MNVYRLPLALAALLAAAPAAAAALPASAKAQAPAKAPAGIAAPAPAVPALLHPRAPMHQALHDQCRASASDPKNPWAMAHGITGLGASFAARDGRQATTAIVADFLRKNVDPAGSPWRFDRYAPDGTPVEPHPNLLVKTLVQAGQPLETSYETTAGPVTLGELVQGVKRGFRHQPAARGYWEDIGWTLDLLAATLQPGKGALFVNGAGETVNFNDVMNDALTYLERAHGDIAQGMDAGLPSVPKRKQGIYTHSCGGLHLVQAIGSWARHPSIRADWGKRYTRQIDVLFYRLGSERQQYDAALAQLPAHRLAVLVQMVKFYGHFLETTGRLRQEAGFRPDQAQLASIHSARTLLDRAVHDLQAARAFENMERLKTSQRQLYLDLIGDSCHAANGWEFWR